MKKILFLSEMPITNGVIQAQLLPVLLEAARLGYATEVLETIGRFDAQEKYRTEAEKKLTGAGIVLQKINVPRFTLLPSILYFSLKLYQLFKKQLKDTESESPVIYARNYKFIPFLLWAKYFWHISFIYSPRGAYVAERKYYRKFKDLLYANAIGLLEKIAIRKSFSTIVETEEFKKHLEKLYKLNEGHLTIIPNYWDATLLPDKNWRREEMRKKLGFTGKKVIVYTGTVEAWYEFEQMVDLVSRLRKKNPAIFFQLFLKEDYVRTESCGILKTLPEIFEKYGFEKDSYAISSYAPEERYRYLCACDAGICLTTTAKFKTMMLYIKIVDFWGAGLPIIANKEIGIIEEMIEKTGTGALVDYTKWEESIAKINPEKLFEKNNTYLEETARYSSEKVLPLYFDLFDKFFQK